MAVGAHVGLETVDGLDRGRQEGRDARLAGRRYEGAVRGLDLGEINGEGLGGCCCGPLDRHRGVVGIIDNQGEALREKPGLDRGIVRGRREVALLHFLSAQPPVGQGIPGGQSRLEFRKVGHGEGDGQGQRGLQGEAIGSSLYPNLARGLREVGDRSMEDAPVLGPRGGWAQGYQGGEEDEPDARENHVEVNELTSPHGGACTV